MLIIAAAFYFAAAPGPYAEGPLRLVPGRHRHGTHDVVGTVGHALQAWLAGQLVDMLVVRLVLSPMVQLSALNLPRAATILAQTALGALFGLAGIILATPVAAAILAALREVTSDAG